MSKSLRIFSSFMTVGPGVDIKYNTCVLHLTLWTRPVAAAGLPRCQSPGIPAPASRTPPDAPPGSYIPPSAYGLSVGLIG